MLKESEEAEAEHTCVHYNTETSHDNDFFKKLQFEVLGDGSTLLLSDPLGSNTTTWSVASKALVLKGYPVGMSGYQYFVMMQADKSFVSNSKLEILKIA